VRRIGILTGGGDAPGLNAVIRSVVLTGLNELKLEIYGIRNGFQGLMEPQRITELDRASVRGLLWRGGSILGCNNRYEGDPETFAKQVRKLGLDGLIVSGGDGSLAIAAKVEAHGARVVGVPKTIDNDVLGTDQTFGFDTAVGLVADACSRLIDTAESHHRVMIVEVMGRHAGHIALHGALAGSADVALIPEIPYRPESVARVVHERALHGRTYTLVLVAEGAVRKGGELTVDEHRTQAAGREILGGAAGVLADGLRDLVDHEIRSLSLSHLQRGGMPSAFDRVLAIRMGVAAVRAIAEGQTGVFAAYRNGVVVMAPLAEATGGVRKVDPDGRLVSAARSMGLSFGDE
jgi:6-phosphofructokinase 1